VEKVEFLRGHEPGAVDLRAHFVPPGQGVRVGREGGREGGIGGAPGDDGVDGVEVGREGGAVEEAEGAEGEGGVAIDFEGQPVFDCGEDDGGREL
jgi:hypothetical protein